MNGDGQRAVDEPGEAGVTVRRRNARGVLEATTTTGGTGTWSLRDLPVGWYEVEVVLPSAAHFTVARAPSDSADSDFPSDGRLDVVVSAGAITTVDAGLARADVPATDSVLVPQGVSVIFNVLDNDGIPGRTSGADPPQGWTWNPIDGPDWGSVTCQSNGSCRYTPLASHAGADAFGYTLTNPMFGVATVQVQIEVLHVNDPPVARADRAATAAGAAVTVEVAANGEDPNDPAVPGDPNRPGYPPTISGAGAVSPDGSGSAACSGQACIFTPASGLTGKAIFTYAITDSGRSDPRVANPGVAGGLQAVSPASSSATVEVWVDPQRRAANGFTSLRSGEASVGAGSFGVQLTPTATGSCGGGRPRVVVSWSSVGKATGYRPERRPSGEGATWKEVAILGSGVTTFIDGLVGEARTFGYRVIPLRHRPTGGLGSAASASPPGPTGPAGC